MNYLHAVILGFVEGLTEFLPVSSTAHLMLSAELLGIQQSDFLKTFEIAIQPGAILAVVVLYWKQLLVDRQVMLRIAVAFVPTAILGLLFYKIIKEHLLENHLVALLALAIGGVVLILFEQFHTPKKNAESDVAKVSYYKCIILGCCQALAFVPGVSRAAATIIGGLCVGLNRKAAVEFSFLLAVPTMAAATAKDLWESGGDFSGEEFGLLSVGFVVSFVVALLAIKFLLRFIRTHTFIPFGWYRIVLAVVLGIVLFG